MRAHAASYALAYPASHVRIELGRPGPDAVTVGAAALPLAGFFERGGRPEEPVPAWRTTLRDRAAHG